MTAARFARRGWIGRVTAILGTALALVGCGNTSVQGVVPSAPPAPGAPTSGPSTAPPLAPPPLIDPSLDLLAGPVAVPLELRIPSLNISAAVLGVGITAANVMDAPQGPAADPVWQQAFWFRGGAVPGSASTATITGHVDDVLGRPALFAHLKDLRAGDQIVVRDTRNGHDSVFVVTATATYTLKQTLEPAILNQIYGQGPVAGQGPQPSVDGLAHLTLSTCTGNWLPTAATFDHRLVVYAVSAPAPVSQRISGA